MKSNLSGMRIAVTGATGFIGSHLCRELVRRNAEVHLLAKEGSSLAKISDLVGKARIHRLDLVDYDAVKNCIRLVSPDKIFHLAAFANAGRSPLNSKGAVETNVIGTINLLNAMEGTGCERFINTGTCEEYGQNRAPFRETQQPDPVSPYSASKSAAVLFCNMYHRTYGYPITNLRPFLTYGPHQDERMFLPSLIISALRGQDFKTTGGKQTREMNYVTDIVEGYIKAAASKRAIGETINIGSGKQYNIRHVAEKINELTGNRIKILFGAMPYRDNEIWRLYCSNSKAKKLLGWTPKVGFDKGIRLTIDWYRKNIGMA